MKLPGKMENININTGRINVIRVQENVKIIVEHLLDGIKEENVDIGHFELKRMI